MRLSAALLGLICLLPVAGCDESRSISAFTSPADEKVAAHYIELLRNRDYAAIERDLDPSIATPQVHDALVAMGSLLPAQSPLSLKIVGVRTSDVRTPGGGSVHSSNYTYEYEYPHQWLLINAAVRKVGGATTIIGLNVKRLESAGIHEPLFARGQGRASVRRAVRFDTGAAPVPVCPRDVRPHPVAAQMALDTLYPLRRVLAVHELDYGWRFQPLSFLLFGAGATRSPYGPWMLSVAFPLGAVWFLLRRKGYLRRAAQPALADGRVSSEAD
jgi:hypothetical protein